MHPMLNIAVRAARKAGNLIAKNYETPDAVEASQKGSNDFVTNVDKAAEAVIIDTIRNYNLLLIIVGSDRSSYNVFRNNLRSLSTSCAIFFYRSHDFLLVHRYAESL